METYFKDKVCLVTGGSSGMGLATARLLAQNGAHVWLLARRPELLAQAMQEVAASRISPTQRFGTVAVDVADHERVNAAVSQVIQQAGPPDIVINSAGITEPGYLIDQDVTIIRNQMEINLMGTVHVTKAVLPGMLQRGSGYVVNICSMAGMIGVPAYTGYCASKFAVRGFSDSLRAELHPHGIDVSIVYPPDTETPQLAYDRSVRPDVLNTLLALDEPVEPEVVAKDVLQGMQKKRYVIVPGASNRFFYWFQWILGNKRTVVMDLFYRWAVNKTNKMKAGQ